MVARKGKGNEQNKNPQKPEKKPERIDQFFATILDKLVPSIAFLAVQRDEQHYQDPNHPTLEETCQVYQKIIAEKEKEVQSNPRKTPSLWTLYAMFAIKIVEHQVQNMVKHYDTYEKEEVLSPEEIDSEAEKLMNQVRAAYADLLQKRK